jgi:hypothetical protein
VINFLAKSGNSKHCSEQKAQSYILVHSGYILVHTGYIVVHEGYIDSENNAYYKGHIVGLLAHALPSNQKLFVIV